MDSFVDGAGTTLPLYATIPTTALFLIMILALLRKQASRATAFLLAAIWLRYILSAFPKFSFLPSPLGVSWNALASLLVVGCGLLIVSKRRLHTPGIWTIGVVVAVFLVSSFANGTPSESIEPSLKYLYLLVLSLAFIDAAEDVGFAQLLDRLLWVYLIPCTFQLESIVLGIAKANETDGSRSYIGGYNHESGFSMIMLSGMLVTCLHPRISLVRRLGLLGWFSVALVVANYRTAILAVVPLLAYGIVHAIASKIVIRQRLMFVSILAGTIVLAGVAALPLTEGRYDDVSQVATKQSDIIKPPADFTLEDRKLMSGRALIWSQYYYGWKDSKPLNHLIGFGPDSWTGVFPLYAHNSLISALYETGIFGVVALVVFWSVMGIFAARVKAPIRGALLAAHLTFFILNMATMPFWQIEGLVYYAILCGTTIYWMTLTNPRPKVANISLKYGLT